MAGHPYHSGPVEGAARGCTDGGSYVICGSRGEAEFRVKSIRLSCKSSPYRGPNHRYGGIIIYGYDGESDWYTANGTHCKTAYLVIQDTDCKPTPQDKFPHESGLVHGAIYRNAFGESSTKHTVVGEGFSVENGQFMCNSRSLNAKDDNYHDDLKIMNEEMEGYVGKVVKYWRETGRIGQTYYIKDLKD